MKTTKVQTVILAAIVASGCVSTPRQNEGASGEATAGANRVLAAANRFVRETGRRPRSIHELVPAYIPEMPDVPNLVFHPGAGQFRYTYRFVTAESEEWGCECTATLGQSEFKCVCYL